MLASSGFTGEISAESTKLASKTFGPVTAAEYILLGIVTPVIEGFTNDDETNDNNGVIEGYGTASASSQLSNSSEQILSILRKTLSYFGYFFRNILKIFRFNIV